MPKDLGREHEGDPNPEKGNKKKGMPGGKRRWENALKSRRDALPTRKAGHSREWSGSAKDLGRLAERAARRKTMEAVQSTVGPYRVSQSKSLRTAENGVIKAHIRTIFYVEDPRLDRVAREPRAADPEISIVVFLDTEDQRKIASVLEKVGTILAHSGYGEEDDIDIRRGSIFRKAKSAMARGVSSDAVVDRLTKIERALELAYLDEKQANVDSVEANAVQQLIDSVQDIDRACMRVGSIFLIKFQAAGESVILMRNLSQIEIRALERFPEIQAQPEAALNALATAVESMESINTIGVVAPNTSDPTAGEGPT